VPIGVGVVVLLAIVAASGFYAVNNGVNSPLQKVLSDDARNKGIEAQAYYADFGLTTVVFDLRNISGNTSRLDVFRVVLQYAASMKETRLDSVQLACRGNVRFVINGPYFQKMGQEYALQNPVYTIRTFPENVRTPNGDRAFPEWEGGVLGVLGAQMEDFNRFHDRWYLDDLKRNI
jgi:hypothetical protein